MARHGPSRDRQAGRSRPGILRPIQPSRHSRLEVPYPPSLLASGFHADMTQTTTVSHPGHHHQTPSRPAIPHPEPVSRLACFASSCKPDPADCPFHARPAMTRHWSASCAPTKTTILRSLWAMRSVERRPPSKSVAKSIMIASEAFAYPWQFPDPEWRMRLDQIQVSHAEKNVSHTNGPREAFRVFRNVNRGLLRKGNALVPEVHTSHVTEVSKSWSWPALVATNRCHRNRSPWKRSRT